MIGKIYIGTSGWQYKHWRDIFYPKDVKVKDHFNYYLEFFDTVEINNSFYRLPPKETFTKWAAAVPDDFTYVIKANRFITHMKKLKDPVESLTLFLDNIAALGKKLGPVLFQLPPGWQVNVERLEDFLKHLPKNLRCVFEFRNDSWYQEEVYSLLKRHNCAFCIYELAGHRSPIEITADFIYVRLHGPGNKYQGSYNEQSLQQWAALCREWSKNGRDVFVYFDNDEKAYAAFNALRLKGILGIDKNSARSR